MKFIATRGKLFVPTLGLAGIFALVGGIVVLIFYPRILDFFLRKDFMIKPGSEFFDIWKDVPIPIYQKIYIFNITNPDDFVQKGEKPVLKELGPYVFKGRWMKEQISWNDHEGTVSYKDVKEYIFEPGLSAGDQEEMIYTLNAPLLTVINYVEQYSPALFRSFVIDIMNDVFERYNETLLVHKTVREMIYEGYHEPMVTDVIKVVEPFITIPLKLINDTFAILYEKKHVGDGVFTIKSGFQGIKGYSEVLLWNNKSSLDWWYGDKCNQLSGTDGVQFPPGISRNDNLTLFNSNLCRTVPLKYDRDITAHGIKTFRFAMASDALATGEENPDNKCYCNNGDCQSGIITLNCKKGAPYVLSLPHFFQADPKLQEGIFPGTFNASPELHQTFFDIEPVTGVVFVAAVRVQVNGVIHNFPEYKLLQSVRENIVPVLWLSEEATLDADFARYFKWRVQASMIAFRVANISMIIIGIVCTVSSIVFLSCIKVKVKPSTLKHSVVLNTLNSVYTSVALWPPEEEETKDGNSNEKNSFIK